MGYDDSRLSRRTHVQLTTISQDTHEQAERAVELAIEQIHGKPPREVVVQPHLVVRNTTKAPPDADVGERREGKTASLSSPSL